MRKFTEIIERIEFIRNQVGLNKSRFSGEIGMKPQTYNNFIGSQGSKPNIELIYGIVNRFKVNPIWLLNGSGEPFADPEMLAKDFNGSFGWKDPEAIVRESEKVEICKEQEAYANEIRKQIKSLDSVIRETEKKIKDAGSSQVPLFNGLIKILGIYIQLDPVGSNREIRSLINRIGEKISQIKG